jgi:hypothetical protein
MRLLVAPVDWARTWTTVLDAIARRPLLVWATAITEIVLSIVLAVGWRGTSRERELRHRV